MGGERRWRAPVRGRRATRLRPRGERPRAGRRRSRDRRRRGSEPSWIPWTRATTAHDRPRACDEAMAIVSAAIKTGTVREQIEGNPIDPRPAWRIARRRDAVRGWRVVRRRRGRMSAALIRRRIADVRRALREGGNDEPARNEQRGTRRRALQSRAASERAGVSPAQQGRATVPAVREQSKEASSSLRRPSSTRDPQNLIGRWALPSGATFTVLWLDAPNARAFCSGGGRRWYLTVTELHAMLDRKHLRYLGRGRTG